MNSSDDDDDIRGKVDPSDMKYSDTEELKEKKSAQNSNKNQNEEPAIKEAPKEIKKKNKI